MNPIQLFDKESSSYTYILPALNGKDAVIIDPVDKLFDRDLQQLERMGLKLSYILETHAHADHITSAARLRKITGASVAVPKLCGIEPADVQLGDDEVLYFGDTDAIRALHTPGHTSGSMVFLWNDNVFTGDTLLINGCGRTDFQNGSAEALYESVTRKLFVLPDATKVWPSHDYNGQSVSTIGWEKRNNSRLANRAKEDFVTLMSELNLPKPRLIDIAVPANRNLGSSD